MANEKNNRTSLPPNAENDFPTVTIDPEKLENLKQTKRPAVFGLLTRYFDELTKEFQASVAKRESALEADIARLQKEAEALERSQASKQGSIKKLEATITKNQKQIEVNEKEIQKLEQKISTASLSTPEETSAPEGMPKAPPPPPSPSALRRSPVKVIVPKKIATPSSPDTKTQATPDALALAKEAAAARLNLRPQNRNPSPPARSSEGSPSPFAHEKSQNAIENQINDSMAKLQHLEKIAHRKLSGRRHEQERLQKAIESANAFLLTADAKIQSLENIRDQQVAHLQQQESILKDLRETQITPVKSDAPAPAALNPNAPPAPPPPPAPGTKNISSPFGAFPSKASSGEVKPSAAPQKAKALSMPELSASKAENTSPTSGEKSNNPFLSELKTQQRLRQQRAEEKSLAKEKGDPIASPPLASQLKSLSASDVRKNTPPPTWEKRASTSLLNESQENPRLQTAKEQRKPGAPLAKAKADPSVSSPSANQKPADRKRDAPLVPPKPLSAPKAVSAPELNKNTPPTSTRQKSASTPLLNEFIKEFQNHPLFSKPTTEQAAEREEEKKQDAVRFRESDQSMQVSREQAQKSRPSSWGSNLTSALQNVFNDASSSSPASSAAQTPDSSSLGSLTPMENALEKMASSAPLTPIERTLEKMVLQMLSEYKVLRKQGFWGLLKQIQPSNQSQKLLKKQTILRLQSELVGLLHPQSLQNLPKEMKSDFSKLPATEQKGFPNNLTPEQKACAAYFIIEQERKKASKSRFPSSLETLLKAYQAVITKNYPNANNLKTSSQLYYDPSISPSEERPSSEPPKSPRIPKT